MLPEPFLDRMKGMLGEEYGEFLKSFEEESFQALRMNPLKHGEGAQEPETALTGELYFHLTPVSWERHGYYYEKEDYPGKHPLHEAGAYYIQEPSAMAPVGLLGIKPGQRVLDLCGAPGGKSTQIASRLRGEGLLICNEIHPARAKILSENIERMGVRNACVTNEAPEHLAVIFPNYFDAVLVDAPCSGEGMFRKNQETLGEWSQENVGFCAERQDKILDCAARMLRPGGRLVYSTCTFAPLENEGSVSRFLTRHPEFTIMPIKKEVYVQKGSGHGVETERLRGRPEWIENPVLGLEGTLRLWPHLIRGEGHFAAALRKAGDIEDWVHFDSLNGVEKGIPEKELGEWKEFQGDFLKKNLSGKFLRFGDNLYLAPKDMPGLKGLRVLRPGLHLGTLKKKRFEPSHALALALSPVEAVYVWNLHARDAEVKAYLRGETFGAFGPKGWYLICVDGWSIGWGKLSGGIMKNHYPKGLRK